MKAKFKNIAIFNICFAIIKKIAVEGIAIL